MRFSGLYAWFRPRNAALLAAMALGALAACDASPPKAAGVRMEVVSYGIAFDRGASRLSPAGKAELDVFMQAVPASAVTFAGLAADASEPASLARAGVLKNYLLQHGVPRGALHLQPVDETDDKDTLRVTLEYAKAVPPRPCPDFSKNARMDFNNTRFTNFGCAYYNDMVLQLTNPADYEGGRGQPSGSDGARDSVFIGNYLSGTSSVSTGSSSAAGSGAAPSAAAGR